MRSQSDTMMTHRFCDLNHEKVHVDGETGLVAGLLGCLRMEVKEGSARHPRVQAMYGLFITQVEKGNHVRLGCAFDAGVMEGGYGTTMADMVAWRLS